MANILFKTRGGSAPKGKPRVYFTCHPEDFARSFEKICADVFKNARLRDLLQRGHGKEHEDTLNMLYVLSVICYLIGDYKMEREYEEKLYPLRCKVLGEEHKDTLSTLANIAYTYAELGDYAKAVEIYEKLYPLRVKVLGKDHEQTLKTLSRLEEARGKLQS